MNWLGDDGSDTEVGFSISNDYAKRYNKWRQGEELERLKNKYGDVESDSSTSEEEDEDAVELTKDVEKQFLKTLSALKEKNPKIYDANVRFFEKKPDDRGSSEKKNKKEKNTPLTVAEYTRKQLLEKGHISDEEEKPLEEMTHVEQEQALKESFKDVLKDSDDEEDDWGGMFKKRTKTADELKKEDDDYREWLAGQKETIENDDTQKDLKTLHDYWTDPKLDEREAFLKDYILHKRYLEKDETDKIPSYEEIVNDSGESSDEFDQKQQQFEHKYNFRYEEPDQEFIKRYPRIMEQSLRKKDDKRKKHREDVKARKDAERAKKEEELKRLKTLKRQEIMDKIQQLQQITGNDEMPFDTNDVEGDFDPEEHDRRMAQLFSDEYYNVGGEDEKPDCPVVNEDLEIENWDEWDGREGNSQENIDRDELHCEDPGFIMDCDYDPNRNNNFQEEIIESTRNRRKRRKQSKFASVLAKPKPLFDPKDKTFEKYVDEYYSLDYEDLIGDIPCRFRYRKTVPNDFGLSVEEILAAPDRELNAWASLKKITRRRPDHNELNDVKTYQKKKQDWGLKKKILPTVFAPPDPDEEPKPETATGKKKKKRKLSEVDEKLIPPIEDQPKGKKKKKLEPEIVVEKIYKKKKNVEPEPEPIDNINDNQSPNKKKKKKRKAEDEPQGDSIVQKKKKKKMELVDKKQPVENGSANNKKSKKKGKNKKDFKNDKSNSNIKFSDERLRAFGINPKKFKNKNKNFNKR